MEVYHGEANQPETHRRTAVTPRPGERATVSRDDVDDPPMSDVLDAALTHLVESRENLEDVHDEYPADFVKDCCNTTVLVLRYRTSIESK